MKAHLISIKMLIFYLKESVFDGFINNHLTIIHFQELETKLKEVAANGGTLESDVKNGENVGKRMTTKFLAQVEIKEASNENSKKQQSNAAAENGAEKKEVQNLKFEI